MTHLLKRDSAVPLFVHDFVSYISNTLWLLWMLITGLVLRAESFTRYVWHGYDEWAARHVTAAHRRQFTRYTALGAFIVANFLAYHSSQDDLRTAQAQIASLKTTQDTVSEAVSVEAAGTNQATATPVSAPYNIVVSMTLGGGVILKPSGVTPITVKNITSSNVLIYPPEGAKFDGLSLNEPASIFRDGGYDTFICTTKVRCIP